MKITNEYRNSPRNSVATGPPPGMGGPPTDGGKMGGATTPKPPSTPNQVKISI